MIIADSIIPSMAALLCGTITALISAMQEKRRDAKRLIYLEKRLYDAETKLLNAGFRNEKSEVTVLLSYVDPAHKITTIKILRSLIGGSLKDLKEMVENPPRLLKAGVSKNEALQIRETFHPAKAIVEIV